MTFEEKLLEVKPCQHGSHNYLVTLSEIHSSCRIRKFNLSQSKRVPYHTNAQGNRTLVKLFAWPNGRQLGHFIYKNREVTFWMQVYHQENSINDNRKLLYPPLQEYTRWPNYGNARNFFPEDK